MMMMRTEEDEGGKQEEGGKEAINGKNCQEEEEGYVQCPIQPLVFFFEIDE